MLFVHLAPATEAAAVRRGGLRPSRHRRLDARGVFAMPVLPSYVLTHQWGRELRRRGYRSTVAVHFRVPDDEDVWVGHYGRDPVRVTAAEAAAIVRAAEDPRGYEVFVPRKVAAREIHRVRPVNPVTGWRYVPGAHGRPPCACPACLPYGSYGAARIRARFGDPPPPGKPELLARLSSAWGEQEIVSALWELTDRRWRGVAELEPFATHRSEAVREALAEVLGRFRGPSARALLGRLAEDEAPAVRAAAAESLTEPR